MVDQVQVLRPETLVEEFKKNGVTHVVTIPDSETNYDSLVKSLCRSN